MQQFRTCTFLLCLAVASSSAASAAPAKKEGVSGRDKAIAECVALAKSQAPLSQQIAGTAADPSSGAMATYKSCMQGKGYRP